MKVGMAAAVALVAALLSGGAHALLNDCQATIRLLDTK